MKCCSRSTLGVIIGIINVVGYFASIIGLIYLMVTTNKEFKKHENFNSNITAFNVILAILLIFCMVMIVISGLLVMGIIKRRHKLMAPWLILSAIAFVLKSLHFIYAVIISVNHGTFIEVFFGGIIGLVISGLIFWLIYTLYKDIEMQDTIQPTQVNYQMERGC